jgi:hypothetical protein
MHTLRPLACCVLTAPLLANPLSAQNVAYRVAGGTVGGQNNFGGALSMDFIGNDQLALLSLESSTVAEME